MALGLLACQPAEREAEGPLEVVVPQEPATLDPRFATRSLDVKLTRLVHVGLFGLDPDTLKPTPLLVQAHHFEDARTLRLELRPGLRFHGGQPLRPTDVCATLRAVADPALASPHRPVVQAIAECTPDGARGLTLRWGEPRATVLSDLEIPILRADQARLPPQPEGALDGLGPYRVARWSGAAVELDPQATAVLPEPRHAVVVRTVRDENARALRLLAGRSDVAPNAFSPTLLPTFEALPSLSVLSREGANVTYLLFQNDRAPLDRAEVRRGIASAIDRELIVRTLLSGGATVAESLIPPGHWAFARPEERLTFAPARARPILSKIAPLTLLTGTDRLRVTIARAMAQMLESAGLEVRVVPLDFGALLDRLDRGDFEMAILQMPEFTEPNVLHWFFHARGVPGEGGAGRNRARYRSAQASRLLQLASEIGEVERRREAYAELTQIMASDMPVVPLWHEHQTAVVSARAREFQLSAEGRWLGLARLP